MTYTANFLKAVPASVEERVKQLLQLQSEQQALFKAYQERLLDLEKEFHAHYVPLYNSRSEIIIRVSFVAELLC